MSVHTCQPSPFGHLRRERHIEWLRRVSQKEWRGLGSPRAYDERRSPTSGGRGTVVSIQETCVRKAPRGCALTECAARKGDPRASENRCPPRAHGEAGEGYVEVKSQGVQTSLPSQPERGGEKDGGPGFLNGTKTAQDGGFVSDELQLMAGVDQLCITSRDKSPGLSCSVGRSYAICTRKGKKLFVVLEETDCLCLHLCGPARSSCLRLHDQNAREVLRFCRPYRMDVCCMACCLMEMRAFTAAGKILGTVRQRWSLFSPLLEVCDSEGCRVMNIHGCWSATRCYADQEFQVTSLAGHSVAVIWKRWPGYNEDCNMDHDFFGLDISAEISQCDRALLLAAVFLLNYMFFEMS